MIGIGWQKRSPTPATMLSHLVENTGGTCLPCYLATSREGKMSFTIDATSSRGDLSLTCGTALETLNKVRELERQPHGTIVVKDGTGRTINIDELTALCAAEA